MKRHHHRLRLDEIPSGVVCNLVRYTGAGAEPEPETAEQRNSANSCNATWTGTLNGHKQQQPWSHGSSSYYALISVTYY